MANAYGTLLNGGVHVAPRTLLEVRDADGQVLSAAPEQPQPVRRAMPAAVAEQVVEAMSGVTEPGGTARAARQDFPVWGKTGTTNDSTNAWFIGCSREGRDVCIAVWMGYDDERCTGGLTRSCGGMEDVNGVEQVYGGTLPAEIYDRTWEILEEVEARRAAEPTG